MTDLLVTRPPAAPAEVPQPAGPSKNELKKAAKKAEKDRQAAEKAAAKAKADAQKEAQSSAEPVRLALASQSSVIVCQI